MVWVEAGIYWSLSECALGALRLGYRQIGDR